MFNGATWDRLRGSDGKARTKAGVGVATGVPILVWTPASNKRFRLLSVTLSATIAGLYQFNDNSSTVFASFYLAANAAVTFWLSENGYLSLAANNPLYLYNQTGSTAALTATAFGTEE